MTIRFSCRSRADGGFSLFELATVLAVFGIATTLAVPPIANWVGGLRVEMAAAEVAGALQQARLYAARSQVNVAVKFRTDASGVVTYALYRDGDRDGVRNQDIDRGVDPVERAPHPLARFGRDIRFGFPPGKPPYEPGRRRRMTRLEDPIRFNRSDLASFSSLGTATPGSVYLTDGRRHLAVVRVNNRAGKVTVLRYHPEQEIWY